VSTPSAGQVEAAYYFGTDFLKEHDIRHEAWDLGLRGGTWGVKQCWALRIERRDDTGKTYDWTWTSATPPHVTEPDWDEEIALKARAANDGRLPFDTYITENLGDGPSTSVNRHEYRTWVDGIAVWFTAREFFGWDPGLISSFLSVTVNEI